MVEQKNSIWFIVSSFITDDVKQNQFTFIFSFSSFSIFAYIINYGYEVIHNWLRIGVIATTNQIKLNVKK